MTQVQSPRKIGGSPFPLGEGVFSPAPAAHLIGLGCAVPNKARPQSDIAQELAELWSLNGASLGRWRRIIAGTAIDQRHGIASPREVMHLTTAERMRLYEQHAPALAAVAADKALDSCNISPAQITDLIIVSCTGFSAPGLDIALVERLGLPHTVRRSIIGFMGCFGAITGLRAAAATCAADPNALALVVCCELCSLHVRPNVSMDDQVAAALFADGAAAAVVACDRWHVRPASANPTTPPARVELGRITTGRSLLLPEGRDWMTWRITQNGFAMTLDKAVPNALQETLARFVREDASRAPRAFIIHPGGAAILEAVDQALGLQGEAGIDASWEVLRRYGNMSSATVLFVLEELHRTRRLVHPALLLAFGPGLTIESIGLVSEERSEGKG